MVTYKLLGVLVTSLSILFMALQFVGAKRVTPPWWASDFMQTYLTPFAFGGIIFGSAFLAKGFHFI